MARINLLPWRETQRKEREKKFHLALGLSAGLTIGAVLYINTYINGLIEYQTQRNNYLQQQITIVDAQIRQIKDLEKQKEDLLARMKIIQRLQASRPQIVRIFDELARALPDGVHIDNLSRKDHVETLRGVAESNARISVLMRNLETSDVFQNPRLDVIERTGRARRDVRAFTLRVDESQRSENSGEDAETQ